MPRKARKAPTRAPDPLDEYSTWDIRIAKVIYYGIIIASLVTVLGIWLAIIGYLIETGRWDEFLSLGIGWLTLIIVGIVVAHMFLLVLFYTLFRGGILKLCKRLFKDRLIAKKFEDFTTLRLLIAVTLISIYVFIITLIVVIIPSFLVELVATIWTYIITHFNFGEWVLLIGVLMFFIIAATYVGFVLWNHGVYAVLKRVKRIEEEYEIDEELKREAMKAANDEELYKIYKRETGKKATYRGKETKGYEEWKRQVLG